MPQGGKRISNKVKECVCENCDALFVFTGVGRIPQYCSSKCKNESRLKKSGFLVVCERCGKKFQTLRSEARFCSYKCAGEARTKETHYRTKQVKVCPICGDEFKTINRKQICCSQSCGWKYLGENAKKHYICEYCNQEFYSRNGYRMKYCSRECAIKALHGTVDERAERDTLLRTIRLNKKMISKICHGCGAEFNTTNSNKVYCSNFCRYNNSVQVRYEPRTFVCKTCGKIVTTEYGNRRSVYCSVECERTAYRKEYKAVRNKQMRIAYRAPVSFKKIYTRDEGVCQICGLPVVFDKSPEKSWSATIDHIIPLSVGGTHEPGNCQLAHRLCNSLKLQASDDFAIDWDEKYEKDPERWAAALEEYVFYMAGN